VARSRGELGACWAFAFAGNAFNGNANLGIAPNKNFAMIGAADMIIRV